jgi:hypothetical protein
VLKEIVVLCQCHAIQQCMLAQVLNLLKLDVSVQYIPAAEDVVVGIVVERYAEVCPGKSLPIFLIPLLVRPTVVCRSLFACNVFRFRW